MSAELFVLLILIAGTAYWYLQKKNSDKKTVPPCQPFELATESPKRDLEEIDPFLHSVSLEKKCTYYAINNARRQYESELETRFADDVKLKERLSQFAREHELDKALTSLWSEIRHYPAWSSRDDLGKWNKLNLTGIAGSKDGDVESVEFAHGDQRFKIAEKQWYGMEGGSYSDISLFEDSEEVFSVSCTIHGEYDTDVYRCNSVSAFKKRGNWARVLLEYYAYIQIERNKLSAKLKYFRADEIKSRFEE